MPVHTPRGDPLDQHGSASGIGSHLRSSSGSGLPNLQSLLRESKMSNMRAPSNTQPSYDLLTGAEASAPASASTPSTTTNMRRSTSRPSFPHPASLSAPGASSTTARVAHRPATGPSPPRAARAASTFSHDSSKENVAPPDAEEYESQRRRIESLKAEVGTLRYALSSAEQERELARLHAEGEVRDALRRADEEFGARQAAEAERARTARVTEAIRTELEAVRAEADAQRRELDKKVRDAEEEARVVREQLEDLSAAKDESVRMAERRVVDLQGQAEAAKRSAQELEKDGQTREALLRATQEELVQKDAVVGNLEAEVLRLKAHTGDAETMAVIRRELSDQVNHIRALEATNREQLSELKHLRQVHRAVEVVEEEKRSLQRRLNAADHLQAQLAEERHQRQRLEDERRAWTAYLQSETSTGEQMEFDSPEAMARALVQERLNSASLVEKLGAMQPEIAGRDAIIKALEDEKASFASQLEMAKASANSSTGEKARQRAERLRQLANKEVENLRQQLKTFDAEDITFQPENFDKTKADHIDELERLVDDYKQEVETLHGQLTSLESASASPTQPPLAGSKRSRDADAESAQQHEQLGQLARKNRKLQDELSTLQNAHRLLQTELTVTADQLHAAREQSKVRVLSLRSNPTSDFEAIKASTISALKAENADLLAALQSRPGASGGMVPASQLAAAKREVAAAQAETASAHKSARRLKEVWAAKSAEFREAVSSTLGWNVAFIPGGKMRVESAYLPSATDEHENSIVFDGEKGTMKVGGGPSSPFAHRIAELIRFWVREKGCIPGFLAAMTLEFYEEQSRTQRIG